MFVLGFAKLSLSSDDSSFSSISTNPFLFSIMRFTASCTTWAGGFEGGSTDIDLGAAFDFAAGTFGVEAGLSMSEGRKIGRQESRKVGR